MPGSVASVQIIALTGGIASGKSTVSARLAEHGAVVVDADKLAREVVEPGQPALAQIVSEWGERMLLPDGSLNRPELGALVFSDKAALLKLNSITHPAVWRRAKELFTAAETANPAAVVVYDVPLLVEASADRPLTFDRVVVVNTSRDERIRRLMTDRPHRYLVRSSDDRALAAALIADACTAGLEVDVRERALRIQAVDFGRFTELLPRLAKERGIRLYEVSPSDESLESVFSYLVAA